MANNRLYIGCKRCREWGYLSKNFGEPFILFDKDLKVLNDFMRDHAYCNRDGSIPFELFDENTDDPKTWGYYMKTMQEPRKTKEEDETERINIILSRSEKK